MLKFLIGVHVLFSFVAVTVGTATILQRHKANHPLLGKCYLAAISAVGLSGLVIYKGGPWNLTHFLAFVNLALILIGHLYYFLYKKDFRNHGRLMTWSVLALYLEVLTEGYYRLL
jgi:uncharacterized membrane protein